MNKLRTWGFRFVIGDAVAFAAFAIVLAGLRLVGSRLGWVVAIVGVHFFLFCNVFRVSLGRELIWAAIFILNVGFWVLLARLDWFTLLACQMPVTVGVIAWEIKATRYHGIFADRLNSNLGDYLESHIP